MIVVTLVYADGSQWIAGGFPSPDAANTWADSARAQPDWDPSIQIQIVDSTPPTPTPAEITTRAWAALRARRDALLAACDWTQLPDTPLESSVKIAWESYRQTLRELPDQAGLDPANPTWPAAPGAIK